MGTGRFDYKVGGNTAILPAYIPDFQRDYAWNEEVGKKLFQDLVYNTYPMTLIPQHGGQGPGDYHLGHMLTFDQVANPGKKPIVDGQQRLFTLTIISCHLRDIALERGWNDLAWNIDKLFIWAQGGYGQAKMLFQPKNSDYLTNQKMNPYKVLLRLCEIDHTFRVEVLAQQNQGANVSIQIIPLNAPWQLREGVKIQFDNGGELVVSNQANQGTQIASISGRLDGQNVDVGDEGIVILGQKSGEEPIVSSLMGKAISNLRKMLEEFIDNTPGGMVHLGTARQRCEEFFWSLQSVNFDMTNFSTEGSAIRHFGITNSSSHKITLSSYDLLRAKILRIRDGVPAQDYNQQGTSTYDMFEEWKKIRSLLERKYPGTKNDGKKKKFFVRYLQSKGLPSADVSRTLDGLIDQYYNQITRQWNRVPITQLLGDIFKFLKWHEGIWNFNETGLVGQNHLLPAQYHEEEFYLLLQPKSFTQWIPLYLAAKNKFTNPAKQTDIVILLKHVTEFFGKGSILSNLDSTFPSVAPNQFWGKVPGWIESVNQLNNPTNADVTAILNTIKTDIDDLLAPIIWTTAHITTNPANNQSRTYLSNSNTSARFLLCLIEKDLGGIEDGNGRYQTGMSACDVEHVLAKSLNFGDKAADYVFTQQNFEESKHRLGNRLLLTSKANNHIKTISFSLKMSHPTCAVGTDCNGGGLHYDQNAGGQWKLIADFLARYSAGGIWNLAHIQTWETELLTKYHGVWP
jgi:hypothetical protein